MRCDARSERWGEKKWKIWGKVRALNKGRRFLGLSQTLPKCLGPFQLARPAHVGLSRAGVPGHSGSGAGPLRKAAIRPLGSLVFLVSRHSGCRHQAFRPPKVTDDLHARDQTGREYQVDDSQSLAFVWIWFCLSFLSLLNSMSSVALRFQGASAFAGARGISHSWRPLRSASSVPSLPGSLDASRYYTRPLNGSWTNRQVSTYMSSHS